MQVELQKEDLVSLVMGQHCPSYDIMELLIKHDLGTYTGGFREEWNWNRSKLATLSEEILWELYNKLKGR